MHAMQHGASAPFPQSQPYPSPTPGPAMHNSQKAARQPGSAESKKVEVQPAALTEALHSAADMHTGVRATITLLSPQYCSGA